jgi:predicted acylesterase/phospholipase RssA
MMKRALVLAGGGVAGIAWELGVLRGIGDIDAALQVSITAADVIVGTSAGSAVAAQITSGAALDDLYAAQLAPASNEIEVDFDLEDLMARFTAAAAGATSAGDMRRRIGALLDDEIELLKPGRAQVVHADPASVAAFGTNPLSPATRGPAARAGRDIGQARAADLAVFWN